MTQVRGGERGGPEGKWKPSDGGKPIPALDSLQEEVKLGTEGRPVTLNSGSQNGPCSPGLRTTWVNKTLDSQRHPHLPDPRFWGRGPASAGTSLSYTLKLTNPTLLDQGVLLRSLGLETSSTHGPVPLIVNHFSEEIDTFPMADECVSHKSAHNCSPTKTVGAPFLGVCPASLLHTALSPKSGGVAPAGFPHRTPLSDCWESLPASPTKTPGSWLPRPGSSELTCGEEGGDPVPQDLIPGRAQESVFLEISLRIMDSSRPLSCPLELRETQALDTFRVLVGGVPRTLRRDEEQ